MCGAAALYWWPMSARARLLGRRGRRGRSERRRIPPQFAAPIVGLLVFALFSGAIGALLGVAAAVASFVVVQRGSDSSGAARQALERQAAEVADLLAACAASGASLERSMREVAPAVGDPAGTLLAEAAAQMSLGAAPEAAWSRLHEYRATAPLARAIVRSLESGAPLADALSGCATELRSNRHAKVEAMARSVAVSAVGPLGLCFLPAFLLLGVVPLVAGLLTATVQEW